MSGWQVNKSCRGSLGAGQPLFWGLVSWVSGPFGPRSFFILAWDSGEYGPWNALWGERLFGRLLFWTDTLAGDMTFVVATPFNRKVI